MKKAYELLDMPTTDKTNIKSKQHLNALTSSLPLDSP